MLTQTEEIRNQNFSDIINTMDRRLIEKAEKLLSKERGTIFKDPGGRINICLVYPNTYRVGMSNLGFQGIYGLLNRREDVVCERAFLPDEPDIKTYRKTNTPVFSFESKRPLNRFDIVAFSLSFENDYPNVLRILDLASIPLRATERNEHHPLMIAGGVCCFFNPEPVAPAFDIMFVGEAEESLNEFIEIYSAENGKGSNAVKIAAAGIEGIYVPEFYDIEYNAEGTISKRTALNNAPETVRRTYIRDLSLSPVANAITTPESEFSDMYLIEAMRGCPWNCRFCLVGQIYSPPRKKDLIAITDAIEEAKKSSRNIGLIGPSLTDYAHIKDVLGIEGVVFSITSLRASAKSSEIVALMEGHKSVSIAPEAGTERMRKVVNKKVTEKDILETSSLIFNQKIKNLRLYFMLGLPTETDEDVAGIVDLVKKIRHLSPAGNIILSLSTFVPKPCTPFQWHPMEHLDTVKRKMKYIKKELGEVKGTKVFHDVPRFAHMQGLFSTGDRRVFDVLAAMVKTDDYRIACREAGIDIDFYIFRKKSSAEILAWDFIESSIDKDVLWNEYADALYQGGDL